MQKHIFGPVPSRRLGRSLGVDPIPFKTCSFDCIYCQLGPTTNKTIERRGYVSADVLVGELAKWREAGGDADFITLSGSGEPTLNSELGLIIDGARRVAPEIPIAVLTNGSLLWDEQVRAELAGCDVLLPSLDAADEETFQKVNRPAAGLELSSIIEGLAAARRELSAEMWLEVMLVRGVNDNEEHLRKLREAIEYIQPHRVQINTPVRPPAESCAQPLDADELKAAAEALGPRAEIIAPVAEQVLEATAGEASEADVLELLRRRPCTAEDVAAGLGIHVNHATKLVSHLLHTGAIRAIRRQGRVYYAPAE